MTDDTTDDATDESPADAWTDDDAADAADATDAAATDGEAGEATDPTADGGVAPGNAGVREYLLKGALVMLVVLGVVATLQFYLSAQTAIGRLASDEFRPAFLAAFHLVVLLAVGVGIAQVVRRLG